MEVKTRWIVQTQKLQREKNYIMQISGRGTGDQLTQLYLQCADSEIKHFGNDDNSEKVTLNANCQFMDGITIWYTDNQIDKLQPYCNGVGQGIIGYETDLKYKMDLKCDGGVISRLDFTFSDPFFGKTYMTSLKVTCNGKYTPKKIFAN